MSSKDNQIQELKSKFNDVNHKSPNSANSFDIIEFNLQLDNNVPLRIPLALYILIAKFIIIK